MYLARELAIQFPDQIIIIMDNRIVTEHVLKDFSRNRNVKVTLLGKKKFQVIKKLEMDMYRDLKENYINVLFLYTKNIKKWLDDLMTKYANIKFIYDATGGRFHDFQARTPAPIINLGKYNVELKNGNYYIESNKIRYVDEHYVGSGPQRVVSFVDTRGQQYSFFGAVRTKFTNPVLLDRSRRENYDKPDYMYSVMNKKETWDFINQWGYSPTPLTNHPTILQKRLTKEGTELLVGESFEVSVYDTGLKVSKYHPVEIFSHNDNDFLLSLVGDSLATVSAIEGSNIDRARAVIKEKTVPLVRDVQLRLMTGL